MQYPTIIFIFLSTAIGLSMGCGDNIESNDKSLNQFKDTVEQSALNDKKNKTEIPTLIYTVKSVLNDKSLERWKDSILQKHYLDQVDTIISTMVEYYGGWKNFFGDKDSICVLTITDLDEDKLVEVSYQSGYSTFIYEIIDRTLVNIPNVRRDFTGAIESYYEEIGHNCGYPDCNFRFEYLMNQWFITENRQPVTIKKIKDYSGSRVYYTFDKDSNEIVYSFYITTLDNQTYCEDFYALRKNINIIYKDNTITTTDSLYVYPKPANKTKFCGKKTIVEGTVTTYHIWDGENLVKQRLIYDPPILVEAKNFLNPYNYNCQEKIDYLKKVQTNQLCEFKWDYNY